MKNLIEAMHVSSEIIRQLVSGLDSETILSNIDINDEYLLSYANLLEEASRIY